MLALTLLVNLHFHSVCRKSDTLTSGNLKCTFTFDLPTDLTKLIISMHNIVQAVSGSHSNCTIELGGVYLHAICLGPAGD